MLKEQRPDLGIHTVLAFMNTDLIFEEENDKPEHLQIIGGFGKRHWICVHYARNHLNIYDSLRRGNFERLNPHERNYIVARYPDLRVCDITFKIVQRQPDNESCGLYACAFATSIASYTDPERIPYSRNTNLLRENLAKILEDSVLREFPLSPDNLLYA